MATTIREIVRNGVHLVVEDGPETSHWKFWSEYEGSWGAPILAMIDKLLPNDGKLLDIGAWVGPMTLWAAQRADVVALEPDPIAYKQLVSNVEANGLRHRVKTIEAAAAYEDGELELYSHSTFGYSHSSMTRQIGKSVLVKSIDIVALTLQEVPDLVKIDIEGGEAIVVPLIGSVMRSLNIPLLLSVHPGMYGQVGPAAMNLELSFWKKKSIGTARSYGEEWLCTP